MSTPVIPENIDVSTIDDNITVEEYLTKQCNDQIERLRKHSEELVEQFKSESAAVRSKLVQRLGTDTQ